MKNDIAICKDNIQAFLDFNYQDITIKYVASKLCLLWLLSMLSSAFTSSIIISMVMYLIINIIISFLSVFFFVKDKSPKFKFMFDGITFTYLSIIFFVMSYYMATYGNGGQLLIIFLMVLLMSANIVGLYFVVKSNIRRGVYFKKNSGNNVALFSFFGAILGIGISRIFLYRLDQDFTRMIISTVLFFVALVLNFGTMEFLKVYYYTKLHEIGDKNKS